MLLETVGDDQEVFLQLVDIFNSESAEKLANMRQAATASDFTALGHHSHALKGTVGPLGADALVQMLIQIEDECDRNECSCDEQRLQVVESELSQVRSEVQQFVAKL
jgi:HPt (histidine-containing phosphotransfer) domain-containing protein